MSGNADIGLIGLAVMGQNLVLNMNDHGYKVAVFNRTISKVDTFLDGPAKGTDPSTSIRMAGHAPKFEAQRSRRKNDSDPFRTNKALINNAS